MKEIDKVIELAEKLLTKTDYKREEEVNKDLKNLLKYANKVKEAIQ